MANRPQPRWLRHVKNARDFVANPLPCSGYVGAMYSPRQSLAHRVCCAVALVAVLTLALSWYFKGSLPEGGAVSPRCLQTPLQTPTARKINLHKINGFEYMVEPQAEYDISGCVVSTNAHWREMFGLVGKATDTPDVGMVWGENLTSGDINKVDFWSGDFTLFFQYGAGVKFFTNAGGNVHVLAATPEVYDIATGLRRGDQIRMRGALVNYYRTDWGAHWRKSSLTRDDMGPTACEVMFVEQIEIIERGTPVWYFLFSASFWLLLLSLAGIAGIFARAVTKPRPRVAPMAGPVALPEALQPAVKKATAKIAGQNQREIEPWH